MSDADKGEEGTSAIPLIIGVLVALTIGYWVFSGGNEHDSNELSGNNPAAAATHG